MSKQSLEYIQQSSVCSPLRCLQLFGDWPGVVTVYWHSWGVDLDCRGGTGFGVAPAFSCCRGGLLCILTTMSLSSSFVRYYALLKCLVLNLDFWTSSFCPLIYKNNDFWLINSFCKSGYPCTVFHILFLKELSGGLLFIITFYFPH